MSTSDQTTTTTITTTTTTTSGGAAAALLPQTGADFVALNAVIPSINLLDNASNPLTFDDGAHLANYHGERLFCKYDVTPVGNPPVDTLQIELGNAASGIRPSVPQTRKAATQATVTVHYDNFEVLISQPVRVTYSGGPLQVSAQVASATKWDKAVLTLTIEEKDVADGTTTSIPVPGYVITENAGAFELRWIDNPLFLAQEKTLARPVPPFKLGGGIAGPMGIETP